MRGVVVQVYAKQRLTGVLFDSEGKIAPPAQEAGGTADGEGDDDTWLDIPDADADGETDAAGAATPEEAAAKGTTLSRRTAHTAKKRKVPVSKKASQAKKKGKKK
jgi:hypothetical protein